jgi:hypothetical protein
LYLQNHPIIASTGGKKNAIIFFENLMRIYNEGCKTHHFLKSEEFESEPPLSLPCLNTNRLSKRIPLTVTKKIVSTQNMAETNNFDDDKDDAVKPLVAIEAKSYTESDHESHVTESFNTPSTDRNDEDIVVNKAFIDSMMSIDDSSETPIETSPVEEAV